MIFITSLGKIRGRHTSLKIGRTMSYVPIIGDHFAVLVFCIIFHGLLVPFQGSEYCLYFGLLCTAQMFQTLILIIRFCKRYFL